MKFITALLAFLSLCIYGSAQLPLRVYELYPNINTVGIMLVFNSPAPPGVTTRVFYEEYNGSSWGPVREGLELSHVTDYTFAGVVLNTKPFTQYRVRVTMNDGNTVLVDSTKTVVTKKEISSVTPLRTFYVSPAGTGISQNSGSPGKLDQAFLNTLIGGDKIILLPGTYYLGELLLNTSGTEQSPISFEGRSGVVIDGSIDTAILWKRVTIDTSNIDYNMFYANLGPLNTNCIILNNHRLYPYRNLVELSSFQTIRSIDGNGYIAGNYPIGINGFFRDGRSPSGNYWPYINYNPNTYVKFVDGSDTSGKVLHVSRMGYAFKATAQSNIQFRNITFRYFGSAHLQQNYRCALALSSCDSTLVDSCHFEFCDRGVIYDGNADDNMIQHSRFDDDFGDWSYFQFKETNEDYQQANTSYPNFFPYKFRYIETGRVYFDHGFTGRGNILRYNVFNGGCDGITCPDTPGDTTRSRNFDIYGNEFMHGADDAFEVDGSVSNVRIWDNKMHGTGDGVSVASPCYGPVYIFRNRIYDLHSSAFEYIYLDLAGYHLYSDSPKASPLKLNATYCDIPGRVYFMHNTCDVGTDAYGFVVYQPQAQSSWQNVIVKNNIIYNESNYYTLWVRCTDKVTMDYNNYYCTQTFIGRKDRGGYGVYNSLQQCSQNIIGDMNDTSSHIELHGQQLNPVSGWRDEPNHDYRLLSSSNMIDQGILIKGVNDDYTGAAPDLGAYEYQPPLIVRDTTGSFHSYAGNDSSQIYDTVKVENVPGILDTVITSTVVTQCDTVLNTQSTALDSSVVTTLDTVFVSYTVNQYDSVMIHCELLETDSVFIPGVQSGVGGITENNGWSVFPNPGSGKFTIKLNNNRLPAEVTLYDLAGRNIFSIEIRNPAVTVDVRFLSEGTYVLKLVSNKFSSMKKLVVAR